MGDTFFYIFVLWVILALLSAFASKLVERRAKKITKWESDEELIKRYREIGKRINAERTATGTRFNFPFDLWREASVGLAYRDWRLAQRTLQIQTTWFECTHLIFQAVLLWFIYTAYDADDVKTMILLGLLFVWRSLRYLQRRQQTEHEHFVVLWAMANPNLVENYFTTERFAGDLHADRVWKHLTNEDKAQRKS